MIKSDSVICLPEQIPIVAGKDKTKPKTVKTNNRNNDLDRIWICSFQRRANKNGRRVSETPPCSSEPSDFRVNDLMLLYLVQQEQPDEFLFAYIQYSNYKTPIQTKNMYLGYDSGRNNLDEFMRF